MKKMKDYLITSVILFVACIAATGQSKNTDEQIMKSIADNIISNATYDFYDSNTEKVFSKIHAGNYSQTIKIKSPYNTWNYWNGVINIAMLDMAEYFDNPVYKQFAVKNYDFVFEYVTVFKEKYKKEFNKWNYPFGQNIIMEALDDCGAMGAGLIEVYKENNREDYRNYIDKVADYILNKQQRLSDGTLVRKEPHEMTLWADDLYMSIVFLARMGNLTGEQKYFDDAVKQVVNFTNYLYDPNSQLYYHCWYSDIKQNGVAHWGRCNGWIMLAQAELLTYLPENHPQRDSILSIFRRQILGISRYQDASGLWHQLLDKNDSYPETSCTAMFTYSIAKAVNMGWIDERYRTIASKGWEGIKSKVQTDGEVQDICVGTGIKDDLAYYYERPVVLNDIHGLGAVLLAGIETIKMNHANQK